MFNASTESGTAVNNDRFAVFDALQWTAIDVYQEKSKWLPSIYAWLGTPSPYTTKPSGFLHTSAYEATCPPQFALPLHIHEWLTFTSRLAKSTRQVNSKILTFLACFTKRTAVFLRDSLTLLEGIWRFLYIYAFLNSFSFISSSL
jgi:hypothetical protein